MPSIDKWHPFHITSLQLCIPFNFYNCTVFQMQINHKKRTVQSRLFKAIKFIFLALLGPKQTQMTDLPTLLYTSASEIPGFYIPEA